MRFRDSAALDIQRFVSYCLMTVFGPVIVLLFRYRYRYSAHDLTGVRRRFREIRRQHRGPILLCTNHLTMIDSVVQGVILSSLTRYLGHISLLPWNLPERKNFDQSFLWRLTCYLGRCIPVTRGASQEEGRRTQARMRHVLLRGDIISIFPEGKRSRTGRVDDEEFSYAPGQLLSMVPEATVVCVYLRGLSAGGFQNNPVHGERFFVDLEVVKPTSDQKGMRQSRDFARQIIAGLKSMEDRFFASDLAAGQ